MLFFFNFFISRFFYPDKSQLPALPLTFLSYVHRSCSLTFNQIFLPLEKTQISKASLYYLIGNYKKVHSVDIREL